MARLVTPMAFVIDPALALSDISPCADKRQPFADRIDFAVFPINAFDLARHPVVWNGAALVQVAKDNVQKIGMFLMADTPEIRHAAHIPKQAHRRRIGTACRDFGTFRQRFEGHHVVRLARPHQHFVI